MPSSEINKNPPPPHELSSSPIVRWWLFAIGWIMIALGVIGIAIPGMPTTVFLIAAVWAFSKSSIRFQMWLWDHRVLGPPVQAWYQYRVIPVRAKILAVAMMFASVIYMFVINDGNWMPTLLLSVVLVPVGLYICTRSSNPPSHIEDGFQKLDEW